MLPSSRGKVLELHGFPPWQLRLTEIQYVSGFLNNIFHLISFKATILVVLYGPGSRKNRLLLKRLTSDVHWTRMGQPSSELENSLFLVLISVTFLGILYICGMLGILMIITIWTLL